MNIIPLAGESLGNRGMCVFIETEDQNIIIDPSVSLAPSRSSLKPHLLEIASSFLSRAFILKFLGKANIIIQTHYHADHYSLKIERPYEFTNSEVFRQIYFNSKATILGKDPSSNINYTQSQRAKWLWKSNNSNLHSADGNEFVCGRTRILFSKAIPHGEVNSLQGWVISVYIEDSFENVLFTSDVVGPSSDQALEFILNNPADLVIVDGPASYHPKQSPSTIKEAFSRLKTLDERFNVVVDHHLLRDSQWEHRLKSNGITSNTKTLAHLLDQKPFCLENQRKILYKKHPLDSTFHNRFSLFDKTIIDQVKSAADSLPHSQKLEERLSLIRNHYDIKCE
ncbi:MAG: hypothetical protein ACTSR2_08605 [Candidatus Hodarchaeales archaeon]